MFQTAYSHQVFQFFGVFVCPVKWCIKVSAHDYIGSFFVCGAHQFCKFVVELLCWIAFIVTGCEAVLHHGPRPPSSVGKGAVDRDDCQFCGGSIDLFAVHHDTCKPSERAIKLIRCYYSFCQWLSQSHTCSSRYAWGAFW